MKHIKLFEAFVNECNVCGASMLISGKTLTTPVNDDVYEIRGDAEGAEFKPGWYQLRKNDGEWTKKIPIEDLASAVGCGGFDIKPEFKSERMITWLGGHFTGKTNENEMAGALADCFEVDQVGYDELVKILNACTVPVHQDDESVKKIFDIVITNNTNGEHKGPLNQPEFSEVEQVRDFLKTNAGL